VAHRCPEHCHDGVADELDVDEYVLAALRAGASGFLLKDAEPDHLIASIRLAVTGDSLMAPGAIRRLLLVHAAAPSSIVAPAVDLELLTQRERDVFRLLTRGRSNAEIAAELYLAEATIKSHVASVLAKLGVRDRVQAVIRLRTRPRAPSQRAYGFLRAGSRCPAFVNRDTETTELDSAVAWRVGCDIRRSLHWANPLLRSEPQRAAQVVPRLS
jgi:DNA-binding CsgD family transcriptional regulator